MRRKQAAAVMVVLGVLALAALAAITIYGESQPMVVDETSLAPVDWLSNGLQHMTDNVNSEESDAAMRDWIAPAVFVGAAAAGFVVIGWLVIDHRRRQRHTSHS